MPDSPLLFHHEFPDRQPRRFPALVRGWVAAGQPITGVRNPGAEDEWLALCPRPDVIATNPLWPHAVGFSGSLGAAAWADGVLGLQVRLQDGTEHQIRQPLEATPLPPDHLQVRQVGDVWGDGFYAAGGEIFDHIAYAFDQAERPLLEAGRVLDFGSGCGRVMRCFEQYEHQAEVWGCDIDDEAISWNKDHLGHVGNFLTNPTEPPMAFEDLYFDAIYTVSVFTHLPEDLQLAWVRELHRIMATDGILVASLHGERYWSERADVASEVRSKGFAYRTGPATAGLPDFYMVAYHSVEYIKRVWSQWFELLHHFPEHIHGAHDAVVLRKR